MNRTEQKERITEIIELANDIIKSILLKKDWLSKTFEKIESLEETIQEFGDIDYWDEQALKDAITNQLFQNELEQLYELTDDFRCDIESYSSDLSDSRREKVEDRYNMLEDVLEKFNQSSSQYDDISEAVENIQEAITELKQMKK